MEISPELDKKKYVPLLLEADPDEAIPDRRLAASDIFVMRRDVRLRDMVYLKKELD